MPEIAEVLWCFCGLAISMRANTGDGYEPDKDDRDQWRVGACGAGFLR